MKRKVLEKDKKKKKIADINLPIEGLHINPKIQNHKQLLAIHEMILVDEELKKNMINKQLERTFRKLVAMILDIEESENTSASDCIMALNEITKIESMIEKKYQKELTKKEYERFLKKLNLLKNKLKEKLLQIRTNEMIKKMMGNNEKVVEKGRGR